MEDPTFHEYPMDSFEYMLDELDLQSLSGSPECYSSYPYLTSESKPNCFPDENLDQCVAPPRTTKKLKTFEMVDHKASASPSSQLISFENASSVASKKSHNLNSVVKKPKVENGFSENIDFAALVSQGAYEDKSFFNYDDRAYKVATTARNPIQAQEHVMAERKRREKLSQRFVALSAMVPGLKKVPQLSKLLFEKSLHVC